MDRLALVRRHYAEGLRWVAGLRSDALVDAFANVPRERFLGAGPWRIASRGGYRETPDADPRHLYHNVLVGLAPERQLNNGQPAFLALLMDAACLAPGEHVVHLGCGVGYYSAVMAEVVGDHGRVTAVEADPELAARAVECLADRANVDARQGDALDADLAPADAILVNFGMTHPARRWVEGLKPGGRLLVPITAASRTGMVLCFERTAERFAARPVSPTQIFSSVSGRDSALETRLGELFAAGPQAAGAVQSLRLDAHDEDDSCWLHAVDLCLSRSPAFDAGPLEDYVGTFAVASAGGEVSFALVDGALRVNSPVGNAPVAARGEACFEAPGAIRFSFQRNAAGHVDVVEIESGGQTMRGVRKS